MIRFADAVLHAAMRISASAQAFNMECSRTADQDQKLHEMVVDTRRARALQDKAIFISNGLVNLDTGLKG